MARQPKGTDTHGIVPPDDEALLRQACPDLDAWPSRWQYQAADLAPGAAIVAIFKPFLLDLLRANLAKKTAYTYRVRAYDAAGNDSDFSASVKVTTPAK